MKATFYGGDDPHPALAQILHFEGFEILLEAGLCEGPSGAAYRRARELGFDPSRLHSALLTRADLTHSGAIPLIVRHGFGGTVFTTTTTQDLCGAFLRDFAAIHENEVERLRDNGGDASEEPIYTVEDAENALFNFNGLSCHRAFHLLRDIRCTFYSAGQTLGSALAVLEMKSFAGERRIAYAGGLGRSGQAILRPPEVPAEIDALILGCPHAAWTYRPLEEVEDELAQAVAETLERGGRVYVPSFAPAAARQVILPLHFRWQAGDLPEAPVYVDSPLAVNVSELLRHHSNCCEGSVRARLLHEEDPFGFGRLRYVRTVEASSDLAVSGEPAIVLAPCPSCDSGPILPHLRHGLSNPDNLVVLLNDHPEESLAGRLANGARSVSIFGEEVEVRARIGRFEELSSRADAAEILNFLQLTAEASPALERVHLVHGRRRDLEALAGRIAEETPLEAVVPGAGETLEI